MKSARYLLCLTLLCLCCTGCVYTHVFTPYDTDLDQTQLGDKTGESTYYSVMGLFAWGDAGTAAAARDGNITTVNHMDQETLAILVFFFTRHTTIVYGN